MKVERANFLLSTVKAERANFLLSTVKAESEDGCVTSQDAVEDAQHMKKDLLDQLEKLAADLPPNTLDELIDELGGPENVAEVPTAPGLPAHALHVDI